MLQVDNLSTAVQYEIDSIIAVHYIMLCSPLYLSTAVHYFMLQGLKLILFVGFLFKFSCNKKIIIKKNFIFGLKSMKFIIFGLKSLVLSLKKLTKTDIRN